MRSWQDIVRGVNGDAAIQQIIEGMFIDQIKKDVKELFENALVGGRYDSIIPYVWSLHGWRFQDRTFIAASRAEAWDILIALVDEVTQAGDPIVNERRFSARRLMREIAREALRRGVLNELTSLDLMKK